MQGTILIVDDHDAVRRSLRDWLEVEFPRWRVIGAASAEEALVLARSELPRVVVMDIALPGLTGIAATRNLKAAMPMVEVVILSIHEGDTYRADAAAAGASAFVPKREMQRELVPAVAALLRNPESPSSACDTGHAQDSAGAAARPGGGGKSEGRRWRN